VVKPAARIDLHAHSDRSDGTDAPGDVVRRAHRLGLDVVALTDHDTTEGWQEAADVATRTGVALVRGIEVSCVFEGYGVHLLAYLTDPTYPPLVDELRRVLDGRSSRLPATLERLRELGIDIDVHDVRQVSGETAAPGRPHVADALVALGVVQDRNEAFDRFLGPQGPAHVRRYAADLEAMIGTVAAAGGVTVLAHPWASRHDHSALDREGLDRLRAAGLAGVEVDHEDHPASVRAELRRLAGELDLVVTGSSDYHGTGKTGHELGCNLTAPQELERLLALAADAARSADRRVPEVVSAR
jgi:predicted metal-dependent phosphoesterase TrpH